MQGNKILAAVDLGSNSFHMIVAEIDRGQIRVLDRMREMVRLGAGLDENNKLTEEARLRAIECLERFGQRLRDLHPNNVRIVGTNTLRKARKSASFIREASRALGHSIEVISGIEEARLIYLGVSHSMSDDGGRKLVVDIGGGSTELIIGEHFEPIRLESLYMGCVSMSRNYFPEGVLDKTSFKNAEVAVRLELEGIAPVYLEQGWDLSIGASGTAKAIARVAQEEGWVDDGISYKSLKKLRKAMIDAGHIEKLSLKGLSQDRVPVFPGGVAVMLGVFESLQIDVMKISDGALREGLIYDMMGRIEHEDVREHTIYALCDRYHVNMQHAIRVEKTALQLLNQVADAWGLDDEEHMYMLAWSARLHEMGLDIAHSQYHRHGAYVVENSDMPGFSRELQKYLAILIGGHRRKFPAGAIAELQEETQKIISRLCVLLRLSVKLHHSRSVVPLPEIKLKANSNGLKITFPPKWMDEHPLTAADMEREKKYLAAANISLNIG